MTIVRVDCCIWFVSMTKITVGCCVDALVGPFCSIKPGAKRRKRSRLTGIVLCSAPDGKWKVYWSSVGKTSEVSRRILRWKAAPDPQSFPGTNITTLLESTFVGGQRGLDLATSGGDLNQQMMRRTGPEAVAPPGVEDCVGADNPDRTGTNVATTATASNAATTTTKTLGELAVDASNSTSAVSNAAAGVVTAEGHPASATLNPVAHAGQARNSDAGSGFVLPIGGDNNSGNSGGNNIGNGNNGGGNGGDGNNYGDGNNGGGDGNNGGGDGNNGGGSGNNGGRSSGNRNNCDGSNSDRSNSGGSSGSATGNGGVNGGGSRVNGAGGIGDDSLSGMDNTTIVLIENRTVSTITTAPSTIVDSSVEADPVDHAAHAANIVATVEAQRNAGGGLVVETSDDEDSDDYNLVAESEDIAPNSLLLDFMAEAPNPLTVAEQCRYQRESERLIGQTVLVKPKSSNQSVNWKCISSVTSSTCPPPKEFSQVGVRDFDFNKMGVICRDRRYKRINFLDLLIHLWPGDWQAQLTQLNLRIRYDNAIKDKQSRGVRRRFIKQLSKSEFWKFWGIILSARVYNKKGTMLWESRNAEGLKKPVNMSEYMTETRHKEIKKYMSFLFADNNRKEVDPWWMISKGIEDFNENRKNTVLASFLKNFDESMSAFRPRTTKKGNLPHLSCVKRKPEPLGTEFKTVADTGTKMFLHLEIQRGKNEMKKQKYSDRHGATVACSKRLAEATMREITDDDVGINNMFIGDSWFASVKTAVQVAPYGNFIGIVKTGHSFYPKKWIETKMKSWPAGSHLVMEGTKDGVELLAVGYKYNKKKVICFIATKGSGNTEPGKPYESKWKDEFGATVLKLIQRPDLICRYFLFSNVIDVGNQSRQFDLKLEKYWVTICGYFRIITTLFGINITDAWKAYKFHLSENHRYKSIEIEDFADLLAYDMLNNKFTTTPQEQLAHTILTTTSPINPTAEEKRNNAIQALFELSTIDVSAAEEVSALTPNSSYGNLGAEDFLRQHKLRNCDTFFVSACKEKDGSVRECRRRKRGKCVHCGKNTSWYCDTCVSKKAKHHKYWCCPTDDKQCSEEHLKYASGKKG